MFFGGYFIRSTSPLSNPFAIPSIFSRSPPPSFPFVRSSITTTIDFFRETLAIIHFFWPLFLVIFCIGLLASFVQPYLFALFAFAFRILANSVGRICLPLRNLAMPFIDPVIQRLPSNWNPFNRIKKKTGGRPRSLSDKNGRVR
ncbi:hypothetical protein V8C35DRAFT_303294 [Trichoderma chlorosporum]